MSSESTQQILAKDGKPINRRSMVFSDGFEHPAARAQLAGAGLKKDNSHKAQIAILHNHFRQNTCNMHLYEFANIVRESIDENPNLMGWEYGVAGVSDGI